MQLQAASLYAGTCSFPAAEKQHVAHTCCAQLFKRDFGTQVTLLQATTVAHRSHWWQWQSQDDIPMPHLIT